VDLDTVIVRGWRVRGQLPRRNPPRRQLTAQRERRRLVPPPVLRARVPGRPSRAGGSTHRRRRGGRGGRGSCPGARPGADLGRWCDRARALPPRARPDPLHRLWCHPNRRGTHRGDRSYPGPPGSLLGRAARDRLRHAAQPGPRARRARGRLPRARRADVRRRPRPGRIVWGTLQTRAPDPRRRGAAARRRLVLHLRLGIRRRRPRRTPQLYPTRRAADLRDGRAHHEGLPMKADTMRLTLRIWRQTGPHDTGGYEEHRVDDARPEMSVLDLLDLLNNRLVDAGVEPVAFDSDCREGICGACGVTVDGRPHGPVENTPSCHQRLSSFSDGDTVRIEPLRAGSFPVIRDLVVDRSALDQVVEAGAYVAIPAGSAPDADAMLQDRDAAES